MPKLGISLEVGRSATSSGRPGGGATPFPNEFSLNFDKSNDYCGVGSDPSLSVYAVSIWFKPSTTIGTTPSGTLVGGWGLGNPPYGGIRLSNGSGRVLEYNDGAQYIAAGDITSIDTSWHHCLLNYVATGYETVSDPAVASNNGQGYEIWLDGTRVDTALGSTSYNFGLAVTSDKFKLAREGQRTSMYFGGSMDELAVFGSSLSPTDIAAIYNSGTPTDLTDDTTLWWRMGDGGTWDGSNWTIPDASTEATGNVGTTTNMAEDDRVTDVPSA